MSTRHAIASGTAVLAAEMVGQGDPVLFLHANVCDSRMWRTQMDGIGARSRAIAYDRRGFGGTRAGAEAFSAVSDAKAVMEALAEGGPAVLVGCSQGGRIALDLALRHPASVRGLVLIAPTVTGAPEANYSPEIAALMREMNAAESSGDLDRVNAMKARLWLDGPLAPEGRVVGEARRLFLEMNGIALRASPVGTDGDATSAFGQLGELSVPALVIWGDFDFPHIQERCSQVVARLPDAAGHVVAGAAHLPSLEQADAVTDLVAAFIRGCPGGRG
ncbi:alpha/beta fold hydrolase [Roseomonas sp. WA12]